MARLGAKVVFLFLTLGLVTIAFGICLIVFHAHITRYQLTKDLILTQDSLAVSLWKERPDFPVYYNIKFYNYTNLQTKGEAVGPYRFLFSRHKRNISFNGVDQVIYHEFKNYSFIPTAEFTLSDKISTHDPTNNAILDQTVAQMVEDFFPNNTETRYVVKSGYSSVQHTGFIINVNNTPYDSEKFYGYNVGADLRRSATVLLFDSDFCLTTPFHFSSVAKINGTSVNMFTHNTDDGVEVEPCARKSIPYTVHQMGRDQFHMQSYIDVEPFTGWILKSALRRKIRSKAIGATGQVLDILEYEESADAGTKTSEQLDDLVFYKMRVINSVAGYFILAGVVMLLILLMAHLRSKRAHADVATPMSDLTPAPDTMFKL